MDPLFDLMPPVVEARPHVCPRCGRAPLAFMRDLVGGAHWLCRGCGRCWVVAPHGALHAADPVSCLGCVTQPRLECLQLLQRDFPAFRA